MTVDSVSGLKIQVILEALESFLTEDLERFPFIMPSFGRNLDVQSVLDAAGIVPNQYVAEADDQTILSMVANGLGVSIFSELVLDGNVENLQAVPLSPALYRLLGMAVARHRSRTPAQSRFISYVEKRKL